MSVPGSDRRSFGRIDALLLLMAAMWGSNFSIIKVALVDFSPLVFSSARFLLIVPMMLLVALATGESLKVDRAHWLPIIGLGLLGNTVYQLLFIFGADRTSADNAALILAMVPVFVVVLGRLMGIERVAAGGWIGIGVSLLGIILIVTGSARGTDLEFGGPGLVGDLLVLLATLAWSIYTVMIRPVVRECSPVAVTILSTAIGGIPLMLLSLPLMFKLDAAQVSTRGWVAITVSALVGICLPYFIWNYGILKLGSARTSIYSYLVPFIALFVAWVWLGETLTPQQLLGGGCVLGGVILARIFVRS